MPPSQKAMLRLASSLSLLLLAAVGVAPLPQVLGPHSVKDTIAVPIQAEWPKVGVIG